MLLDVGDPGRNLVLNVCFHSIVILALVALIPWQRLGASGVSRRLRWLPLPGAGLAVAYELAMPSSYDIRVDLLLLLPVYGVLLATSAFRWAASRR